MVVENAAVLNSEFLNRSDSGVKASALAGHRLVAGNLAVGDLLRVVSGICNATAADLGSVVFNVRIRQLRRHTDIEAAAVPAGRVAGHRQVGILVVHSGDR